jgi:hypothetical protein
MFKHFVAVREDEPGGPWKTRFAVGRAKRYADISDRVAGYLRPPLNAVLHFAITCRN